MITVVHGASAVIGGRLADPVANGDAVRIDNGVIDRVGTSADLLALPHDETIDAAGGVVIPGLIDPHTHPVLGDFTPRQNTLGWVGAHLNGGVTTLISAGETHWPGRQRTPIGAKSIAMAAAQSSLALRPGGAKLHGGALLIEPGLTEADFDEMERAGVRLVGEVGLGSSIDPRDIRESIEQARSRGWVIPMHVGGASVPGSHVVAGSLVAELRPDVVSHANGGPTARPLAEIVSAIESTDAAIEVVQAGNTRALVDIVRHLDSEGLLHRLQFGTDSPSGTGIMPLGILRSIAYSAAFGGVDPVSALCCATGEVAARYHLDVGVIDAGRPADLVILDVPLGGQGSTALDSFTGGDVPSVALVMVDGEVVAFPSRMTPPPTNRPVVAAAH
ncbi:amidohydrolase family protein [Herbiconiux sp. L3-i23]|uniref:amidohydrolase family protein n=1 Tax=Herbiconiux sp. L3-i23 TaxID=2905871 RepID=UPI00204514AF|nr:amidohydrolase family protein [Herbiconiux sp. L3-i23]BDI23481.1 amidohydrolase [Herbiconiux sp. L3-i23]